jgi:hypothetical protein
VRSEQGAVAGGGGGALVSARPARRALPKLGVHEHPTVEDVHFGLIPTYLMAGEVLAVPGNS